LLGEYQHRYTGQIQSLVDIVRDTITNVKAAYDPSQFPKPIQKKPAAMPHAAGEPTVAASGEPVTVGTLSETSAEASGDGLREPASAEAPIRLNGGDATGYLVRVGHDGVVTRFAGAAAIAPEPPEADRYTTVAGAFELALPVPAPAAFADVFAKDSQP
jgi:hypothetical protein